MADQTQYQDPQSQTNQNNQNINNDDIDIFWWDDIFENPNLVEQIKDGPEMDNYSETKENDDISADNSFENNTAEDSVNVADSISNNENTDVQPEIVYKDDVENNEENFANDDFDDNESENRDDDIFDSLDPNDTHQLDENNKFDDDIDVDYRDWNDMSFDQPASTETNNVPWEVEDNQIENTTTQEDTDNFDDDLWQIDEIQDIDEQSFDDSEEWVNQPKIDSQNTTEKIDDSEDTDNLEPIDQLDDIDEIDDINDMDDMDDMDDNNPDTIDDKSFDQDTEGNSESTDTETSDKVDDEKTPDEVDNYESTENYDDVEDEEMYDEENYDDDDDIEVEQNNDIPNNDIQKNEDDSLEVYQQDENKTWLQNKFLELLFEVNKIFKLVNKDITKWFDIIWWNDDRQRITYKIFPEDHKVLIKKIEFNKETEQSENHSLYFDLPNDSLQIVVDDELLFDEYSDLQDDMNKKMQVSEKLNKFIFLVTQEYKKIEKEKKMKEKNNELKSTFRNF